MLRFYLIGVAAVFGMNAWRLLRLFGLTRSIRAYNMRNIGLHLSPWEGSFVRTRTSLKGWLWYSFWMLCIEPLLSWVNLVIAGWGLLSAKGDRVQVPERVKEVQFKLANVKLSREAVQQLMDELASFLGTSSLGEDQDADTLVIDSGDWDVEARLERGKKCYRIHSHPSDYASIFDSDYEYRIDGTTVYERLLYDSAKYYGKVEERVKDNVVLESLIRERHEQKSEHLRHRCDLEEELGRLRQNVEWHEIPTSELKYFILIRSRDALPSSDCRRFLRQELERLRRGIAELRRRASLIGAELFEDDRFYQFRFHDGAKPDWESIRTLESTDSLRDLGLTPGEFRSAAQLISALNRLLAENG